MGAAARGGASAVALPETRGVDSLWVLVPTGQRASGEWIDDTLSERVRERGLLRRTPLVGQFPRHRVEVVRDADPVAAVNARFAARGWTDGLPIIPPTVGRIDEMLGWSRDRKSVV